MSEPGDQPATPAAGSAPAPAADAAVSAAAAPSGGAPAGAAATVRHCDSCGRPEAEGDHTRCRTRRAATDPPRFCTACGRKLVVQVLPIGWTARCVKCGPL